jgi:hypothetical protein
VTSGGSRAAVASGGLHRNSRFVLEVLEGLLEDDDPKVRMAALILKERLGLFDAGGEERELPPGVHRVFIEMPREEDEYETLKEKEQREYKLYGRSRTVSTVKKSHASIVAAC